MTAKTRHSEVGSGGEGHSGVESQRSRVTGKTSGGRWSAGRLAGWAAVHLGSLAPLALLIWDGLHDDLTVNPIQAITQRTGKTALVLLMLSLTVTPAQRLLGWRGAVRLRRPLGLYAFLYAGLHFLTFVVLDYGLDPKLLGGAIFEKRYALAGFAAFLLLVPLAVTSTKGWMRRLGKRWKRLHMLVYPAALLVIVHYVWLVKADLSVPLLYGAILALLMLARLAWGKRAAEWVRGRLGGAVRRGEGRAKLWASHMTQPKGERTAPADRY